MTDIDTDGTTPTVELEPVHALPAMLPVLPLRDSVPLPDTIVPLAVGQARSIKMVDDALAADRQILMVASRDRELEAPSASDLYEIGVAGSIARMMKIPDGSVR